MLLKVSKIDFEFPLYYGLVSFEPILGYNTEKVKPSDVFRGILMGLSDRHGFIVPSNTFKLFLNRKW